MSVLKKLFFLVLIVFFLFMTITIDYCIIIYLACPHLYFCLSDCLPVFIDLPASLFPSTILFSRCNGLKFNHNFKVIMQVDCAIWTNIIKPNQTGFIKYIYCSDNIHCLLNIIHNLTVDGDPAALMSLDGRLKRFSVLNGREVLFGP